MTEPPPMVPSARERVLMIGCFAIPGYEPEVCRASDAVAVVSATYHDGFAAGVQAERARWIANQPASKRLHRQAERARIIAELREPTDEMLRAVWAGYKVEGNWTFAISEALRALADHLEHQK